MQQEPTQGNIINNKTDSLKMEVDESVQRVLIPNKQQQETINDGVERMFKDQGILLNAPTGAGKTLVGLRMVKQYKEKSNNDDDVNVLVISPYQGGTVIEQWTREARACEIPKSQIFSLAIE